MFMCPPKEKKTQTSLLALMSVYRRKEDGTVTIFSVFTLIMMLAMLGIAIDFMRAERNRTVLQHTLDRAILAAADLDQERDAETVVYDYFEAAGLEGALTDVQADQGINYKTLQASAEVVTYAPWLDMLGRFDKNRRTIGQAGRTLNEEGRYEARAECSGEIISWEEDYIDENGIERVRVLSDVDLNHCMGIADQPLQNDAPKTAAMIASATGGAEERVQNVEISMVLDVSGSMDSNSRMPRLREAAKTFVDTVLNETTEGLVSVSVVPYDDGVSLGPDLYNAVRQEISVQHRHNYSHCIEFEDSEFTETGLRFNQTYQQMQHTRLYSSWGFQCATDSASDISPLSQNATALKNQIDALQPSGNTLAFLGLKWATAMLDPSFNPIVDELIADGVVSSDFSDRPAAFDDVETLKTIILMTDGENTNGYRVHDWAYAKNSHYVHWNNWGIKNYLNAYVWSGHHHHYYYTKYYQSLGDDLMQDICTAAKNSGIVIWSIGFETTDHGANEIRDCASSPSHFFRVEGIEISDAFSAIARQINQLRLTQ